MIYRHSVRKLLLTALFVLSLGLMGCDSAAPTATVVPVVEPTATTASTGSDPTADATPTIATASSEPTATTATTSSDPTATTGTAGTTAAACTKLNLNTVSADQLMATVPGFNSRWVREFMEYRPYVSIQQFRKELGKYTDTTQISEWEKYVYVPISPSDSDAATLAQLPGVDDTIAAALVAGRPYASTDAFLTVLGSQVSADQAA
jgi:DNA uptake protein ComE-like DNA-binding protein